MKIRNIMTDHVECIKPDDSIVKAAQKMHCLDIGILPVNSGDKIVGVITDRDIVVRAVAKGYDPQTTLVKDLMSSDIKYCFDDDDLENIVHKMENNQIRRMIVFDHEKHLSGVFSLGDLSIRGESDLAQEALTCVSQPKRQRRF